MSGIRMTLIGSLALTLASPALAQTPNDLEIARSRTIEFGGTLGMMARMTPGMGSPQAETQFIHGTRALMRNDAGGTSTIQDYEAGRIIVADNAKREYYTVTFEEMISAMTSMAANQPAMPAGAPPQTSDSDVEYRIDFSVDRPGTRKQVAGANAELVRFIVRAVPVRARNADPAQLPQFAMVTDSWMANDHPAAAAQRRVGEAAAARFGERSELRNSSQALAGAFQTNRALRESSARMAEEMGKVTGFPIEQTSVFVTLPPGVQLDLQAALNAPIAGPSINVAGAAGAAGAAAAASAAAAAGAAVSGALGGFGIGRRAPAPPPQAAPAPPPPAAPQQAVIMRTTETTTAVKTGPLAAGQFEAPAGYRMVPSPFAQMRQQQR